MILPGVFTTLKTYNISVSFRTYFGATFFIRAVDPSNIGSGQTLLSGISPAGEFTLLSKKNVVTSNPSYTALLLGATNPAVLQKFDIKSISITTDVPAKVSDSDMRWAGRRTSYYQGTKISSLNVNINSANTVDGGPVVVINTVNSDTPSTPLIPLSSEGRRLVNIAEQPIIQSSDRLVDPGRALVNRVEEARRLVNIAGQPIMPSQDRIGRALVNIAGQPVVTTEGRRLVNRNQS